MLLRKVESPQGLFLFVLRKGYCMNQYVYKGPVMEFERCITSQWSASTFAPTEKKARSNMTYQFKKNNNRIPSSKITLPGKIQRVD
jgi:hypothetical protein